MTVGSRLAPFGTSIFAEMTRLAIQHGAVNLAQGFPDFDGPEFAKDAAIEAIRAGKSQYARMTGDPVLTSVLARDWARRTGIEVDPDQSVTVTSGCTEAIASTLLGLLNPGDGVIVFEPFYDSYRACISLAGATATYIELRAPDTSRGITHEPFTFDVAALKRACEARPRAILLNTPHNPTGKVFTRDELSLIAELCVKHDVIAIVDEVYEHLVYDGAEHVHLATMPGMRDRTITLSSLGKTFSLTGWKIGWSIASPELSAAVRAAHQFITFATSTPMQHAAAATIERGAAYVQEIRATFERNRDFLAGALAEVGCGVCVPRGAYFIMADISRLGMGNDVDFCRRLPAEIGVAAIPPSAFYASQGGGTRFARFAFCKKESTLKDAAKRLAKLRAR